MPLPLAAAILAAQGLTAAGTAGLGIAQAAQGVKASKRARELNEEQLNELLALRKSGQLGLSGQQQRLAEQRLLTPLRTTAGESRQRLEAQAAATGNVAAGDIARQRRDADIALGRGSQAAATQIAAEDLAQRQAQEEEIEQRIAFDEAQKRDIVNQIFGAGAQAAGAAGAVAGGVPEVLRATAPFGGAGKGPEILNTAKLQADLSALGVSEAGIEAILAAEAKDPGSITELIARLNRQRVGEELPFAEVPPAPTLDVSAFVGG